MKPISEMTEDEIEACITTLRSRREEAERKVKLHKQSAANARSGSLKERLTRQLELAQKDLDAINKKLDKLEERVNSITALRLQHGDLALDDLADLAMKKEEVEDEE